MKGVDIRTADESVNDVINGLQEINNTGEEMEKVRNKFESATVFSNTSILNKAVSLANYELLGNPELINMEVEAYKGVSGEMVAESAQKIFRSSNCSTLYYKSSRKDS
jgi:zinc protease